MLNFQFYNPVQIHFGAGSISKAADILSPYGKSVVVLTGRSHVKTSDVLDKVLQNLKQLNIKYLVISGIEPNPRLSKLLEAANDARKFSPDCILALGGGSVMDAAKILSLILTHNGDPWEYRVTGKFSVPGITNKLIPVITIPTTAGTGSEASPAALINHNNKKEAYFSPFMYPKAAIIDPELSLTLPADLTAQVGIDAFVQSLEAYVSINAQPFSDLFAEKSMKIVWQNLPNLVKQLDNKLLRSQSSFAGLLSLYAIGQAGVGAVHALSNPLSGRFNIGHGLSLSILLPAVMEANLDSKIEKFASLANLLGVNTTGMNSATAAKESITIVKELLSKVNLSSSRLRDFGISESDLSVFADEAENPDMSTNPKKLTEEQIIEIYKHVL